jgi:dUTP pyrophosphatase
LYLKGDDLVKFITPLSRESLQPAGVDLTLGSVRLLNERGILDTDSRKIPEGVELKTTSEGFYVLEKGAYRIRFNEVVEVPEWAVGFCYPRSSLLRMGASVHCAVWDPGYKGRGEALLVVFNEKGIMIRKGARIAQMVFARLETLPTTTYKGKYLYEGL